MDVKNAWNVLRNCWIDIYIGPPDVIVHDQSTNFTGRKFQQNARIINITIKNIPTEIHHSIGRVERYHGPLRRVYEVISKDLTKSSTPPNKEDSLQMAIKTINNSTNPNNYIPILLVFGIYPHITNTDPPAASIFEYAKIIKTAINAIQTIHV